MFLHKFAQSSRRKVREKIKNRTRPTRQDFWNLPEKIKQKISTYPK